MLQDISVTISDDIHNIVNHYRELKVGAHIVPALRYYVKKTSWLNGEVQLESFMQISIKATIATALKTLDVNADADDLGIVFKSVVTFISAAA